jgi:uncharacterized flavoprotein (TIGR03862 family)
MKKKIAIIGGGTAGLFFASFIDTDLYDVTIYEKKSTLGRKFLVAGDGGFNLTHTEDLSDFKLRYRPVSFLEPIIDHFSNMDLREWLASIGIETFVGSSGKIFPVKGIKPIEVLKAIESHLTKNDIHFQFNKTFTGWINDRTLQFNENEEVDFDIAVFAIGGASWKVTGSDGSWLNLFKNHKVETAPFRASNCAFQIRWDASFIESHEGQPLKNISITINNKQQKGEVVITRFGLEGNAIYGLSPEIQDNIEKEKQALIYVDFKPSLVLATIVERLNTSKYNVTTTLKKILKLSRTKVDLLKATLAKEEYVDKEILANYIKAFPLTIVGSAPIDEAISTSGGISLTAIDEDFELIELKNNFCIGEMLDWDAPTGGYLIQACASMGVYLAHRLNKKPTS